MSLAEISCIKKLMDDLEEVVSIKGNILIYEDLYNKIYDNDGRIIVVGKWRRLSVLIDYLLLLAYILTIIYYQERPNKHVRGSWRTDL